MKNNFSANCGWIIKISLSLLALILTARFSVPLSVLADSGLGLLIIREEQEVKTEKNTASPVTYTEVTEKSTAKATEKEKKEEESSIGSFYNTPEDVKDFSAEYLEAHKSSAVSGSTMEVFFRTSGATDNVMGLSVKNSTSDKKPDFEALLEEGPDLSIEDKAQPTVLIYHTHTTETYLLADNGVFYEDYPARSTDSRKNMLRVGEEICRVLEENGIGFIHDKNVYDESYEGAYSRSRVTVEKYLEEYPTIQIVLDVHRDAIYYSDSEHAKPTAEIEGRKAAQIMIITGAEDGYITDFPNWENNLRFSLLFQKTAEEIATGLMKPIYFCQRKYNMDLGKCSVLLETGTDANTLDEALYSGYLTGRVLTEIVNEYEKKQK